VFRSSPQSVRWGHVSSLRPAHRRPRRPQLARCSEAPHWPRGGGERAEAQAGGGHRLRHEPSPLRLSFIPVGGGRGSDLVFLESTAASLLERPKYGMLPDLMIDALAHLARDWSLVFFRAPHCSVRVYPIFISGL
jgi:hypothetical protein